MRTKLGLPSGTPDTKVLAAFETEAIRRAGRAGLPWNASYPQIEAAERAQAVSAAARKVATATMLGHQVDPPPAVEEFHPALVPVSGRVQQNTSESIDWLTVMDEERAEPSAS
jgi:hypothetical protein